MTRWRFSTVGLGLVLFLWTTPARAISDWTFGTIPLDGAISGEAGSTIGWGYTISNLDEANWLALSALDSDVFQFGTPDASVFDYPILGPGVSLSVPYDGLFGLFQVSWDLGAAVGSVDSGVFVASADWYDADPFDGGEFLDAAGQRSTPYSATVAGPIASVPEPSTLFLMLAGMVVLVIMTSVRLEQLPTRQ
jgi:hypothetical protein